MTGFIPQDDGIMPIYEIYGVSLSHRTGTDERQTFLVFQ